MATLHYAENVHVAQTRTQIPTPYICIAQESEFISESVSGNVNELLAYSLRVTPVERLSQRPWRVWLILPWRVSPLNSPVRR